MATMDRTKATDRTCSANCIDCEATWDGGGAQGAAAHHHDLTGHITVAEVKMTVTYGKPRGPAAASARRSGTPRVRQRSRGRRT